MPNDGVACNIINVTILFIYPRLQLMLVYEIDTEECHYSNLNYQQGNRCPRPMKVKFEFCWNIYDEMESSLRPWFSTKKRWKANRLCQRRWNDRRLSCLTLWASRSYLTPSCAENKSNKWLLIASTPEYMAWNRKGKEVEYI